ncbi:MAG: hypothetical protein JXR27_00320 [Paludibacteraceae bacterium]|nr:hypothetical protein [Paludibacteraceae bacterium]
MKQEEQLYRKEDMVEAIAQLIKGKLISFTDDAGKWIACDACLEDAVNLLPNNPKAHILVEHPAKTGTYVNELPEAAWDLMELSEKPLIVYLTGIRNLAKSLNGPKAIIGFRTSTDKFASDLCKRFRKPLFLYPYLDTLKTDYDVQYRCRTKANIAAISIDPHNRFSIIEQ